MVDHNEKSNTLLKMKICAVGFPTVFMGTFVYNIMDQLKKGEQSNAGYGWK